MHIKWAIVVFLTLALAFVSIGCNQDDTTGAPTSAEFVKERAALAERVKAKQMDAVAPEVVAYPAGEDEAEGGGGERDYFYDPRGKRDPFRSFRFADVEDGPNLKNFGPLGDFELGQLELSAVIWDAANPRALILDPSGRAYIIREGSQIGKNSGHVIHIGDNLVLVKETYEDLAGERTTKDVELRIRLSQGG